MSLHYLVKLKMLIRNVLPLSIRESQSLPTFRRYLKTFCFQSAYPLSAVHLP